VELCGAPCRREVRSEIGDLQDYGKVLYAPPLSRPGNNQKGLANLERGGGV